VARWVLALVITAVVVAGVIFLKADFSREEKGPVPVGETRAKKLGVETPERKTAAPDFTLKDHAGKQFALKEVRGKVVFLNFWATWCPPCIEEMPAIEKLHRDLEKEGLVILAVNFQESPERVRDFFREHNLTFTALLDRDGKVFELYQAWALPVSIVINKRGEIVGRAMGSKDWYSEEAVQLFQKLVAEES
jgi:peroxiredoxin